MTGFFHGFDLSLFRERQRAQRDLEHLRSLLPDQAIQAAFHLLTESPDPDQALNLLERLVARCGVPVTTLLEKNRMLLDYAVAIFGQSYWLGETLIHNPDLLDSLQHDRNLERALDREDYRESLARLCLGPPETGISALLSRFKKREYVRIALRDVLGIATLAESAAEMSALADVILEEALRHAEAGMKRRYSPPPDEQARFAVISLGKLGGNELNYSSDVDLLYVYGGGSSDLATRREYFIRQAQLFTEILCCATPEGPVFRIDLRLRPQGSEGEPAIAVAYALDYYAHAAHDWELQALIKARHSAGDPELAGRFLGGVQARIYTEKLNFAAIETALYSREKIGKRRRAVPPRRHIGIDVKLDRGGIRDIEFLVQCLQRVYGGQEKWLRSGGTLFSLQKLHDKGHISGNDFHELTHTYEFLRRVEHRLQLQRGQQVHRLPGDHRQLEVLRRALRLEDRDLIPELRARMAAVAAIYERIIHRHRGRQKSVAEQPQAPRAATVREMSFEQLLERLALDYASPELHEIAAHPDLSLHTRRNLHRFLSSAMTSPERFASLQENPQRLAGALALLEKSEYLADILVRHPDVVRVLDQSELPALPADAPLLVAHHADAMTSLRRGFRRYAFAIGARDVLAPRTAFQSMRERSRVADVAIRLALAIAGGEQKLAVFALGRLGTCEFDIASDADLLFVRAAETGEDEARTAAETLIHALAAYTREGSVFAVDARLRPHGGEGELVITPQQLERYLTDEAQPWEALSYTKLRFVAGREDLKPATLAPVQRRIVEIAARPGFSAAVREMRARLEKSNRYPHSFKLARGGFYDIDFISSYLMLRQPSLAAGNTLDRLEHLRQAGVLEPSFADELQRAAILYRTADHVIRLVTGRARPELPEAEHARAAVEELVGAVLGREKEWNLQEELEETAHKVRGIFETVIT